MRASYVVLATRAEESNPSTVPRRLFQMSSVRASTIGRFAVLAALSAALLPSCRAEPAAAPTLFTSGRPIVLITIDTLRADRLGAYGSSLGLTPAIDQFAHDAARFTAAVTQVPLTVPAHATILTGLHPARHGVRTNDGFHLAPTVPTLAESLRAGGYATGAFIGGYPLRASSGLARGFDQYDDAFLQRAGAVERSADEVVGAAEPWVEQHKSRPFFVWRTCSTLTRHTHHPRPTPPPMPTRPTTEKSRIRTPRSGDCSNGSRRATSSPNRPSSSWPITASRSANTASGPTAPFSTMRRYACR